MSSQEYHFTVHIQNDYNFTYLKLKGQIEGGKNGHVKLNCNCIWCKNP